jgi:DNA repair exonuclease SbcCD ATPase subunit
MTRYFLSALSVEGFRGINNHDDPLVLKFRKESVNSIHAPNGFCKSSIFEALHYAIYGTVPRLAALQDAECGDSYLVNRFHPGQKATVKLTFESDDGTADAVIEVSRTPAGPRVVTSPSNHPNPEHFLSTLQEDSVLVDYARFSNFIDCSALERGRSFTSLVGLSKYSQIRQLLDGLRNARNMKADLDISKYESAVNDANRTLVSLEQRLLATHNDITGLAATGLSDGTDPLTAALTYSLRTIPLIQPWLSSCTVMDLDFAVVEKDLAKHEAGKAADSLRSLLSTISGLTKLQVADSDISQIDILLPIARERDVALANVGQASVRTLLRQAFDVISSEHWPDSDLCPVCDGRCDPPLKERLQEKLSLYEAVDELDKQLLTAAQSSTALDVLREIEEAPAMAIASETRISPRLRTSAAAGSLATGDLNQAKAQLVALEQLRVRLLADAQGKSLQLQASLPPSFVELSKILSQANSFQADVHAYNRRRQELATNKAILQSLNRWKSFITKAGQLFGDAETDLANARIAEIQTSWQDLFRDIVSGGHDVKPTLTRAGSRENLDLLLADFHGLQNLSARALLSESYRNAVAAAIFFASAAKQKGVPRFMILDDITSSFDAGHQYALMATICRDLQHTATAPGIQFIILSHDTTLEKYFDKINGQGWHHQKLQGMPPKGKLMVTAQHADRLKQQANHYLSAGQIDPGSSYLRQYMEYALGRVITKVEIPVPPDYVLRGDKRTLSTYLDAILDAVRLYEQAGRCVLQPHQLQNLRNPHKLTIIVNCISHYETNAGTPFNAYVLLSVLQGIDDLVDCFQYVEQPSNQKRFYARLDRVK